MRLDVALLEPLCELLRDLHGEATLADALLLRGELVTSCADVFLRGCHRGYVEDPAFGEASPRRSWTTSRSRGCATRWLMWSPASRRRTPFALPADRLVHGDLWLSNLLVGSSCAWRLLDWDGLTLGDPVLDWVMLFGPSRAEVGGRWQRASAAARVEGDGLARIALDSRAVSLDWVIDPLADWVQSGREAFHGRGGPRERRASASRSATVVPGADSRRRVKREAMNAATNIVERDVTIVGGEADLRGRCCGW